MFKKKIHKLFLISFLVLASFYIGFSLYGFIHLSSLYKAELPTHKAMISKAVVLGTFEIIAEDRELKIKDPELAGWIQTYTRSYNGQEDLRLNNQKIRDYLESIAPSINTPAVDARLKFEDSKANVFVPSSRGKEIDIEKSMAQIAEAFFNGHASGSLVFNYTEPEITLDKINDLGINTLIGRGESNFAGSPASRIHNIKTGMGRFNGTILKPEEEFSFNTLLGDVEASTGYKAELVIKNGKLEYEYGGGLCQVSTTVFRSAIYAGLPILERKPHSFPVKYYSPQGFDSTIYPGVVDLRFKNNTPSHILVQGRIEKTKLIVEIYGSDDGRKIVIDGPFQYDQKANGAMKAYFTRTISLNGEEKEERFNSSYNPPPPSPLERNPLE